MPVDMVRQMAPRLPNDTAPWNAYDYIEQCFPFDVEGDVLYDNRGGYNLIVAWLIAARRGCHRRGKRCLHMLHRRGAADV